MFVSLAGIFTILVCITDAASPIADPSLCYEICEDSAIDIEELSKCIQRPINITTPEDGGQGNSMAELMKSVYDAATEANIRPGIGGNATLLAGMNSAAGGAISPSPEGISFCAANANTSADAFYWVPNCNLAPVFCRNLTSEEIGMNGTVAYVVDEGLHNDDKFHRYVFTVAGFVHTNYQSPTLSTGFRCSDLPWFRNSGFCMEPLAMTCPTDGDRGRDSNQIYGSTDTVIVGQQLREGQLAPCLDAAVAEDIDTVEDEAGEIDEMEDNDGRENVIDEDEDGNEDGNEDEDEDEDEAEEAGGESSSQGRLSTVSVAFSGATIATTCIFLLILDGGK